MLDSLSIVVLNPYSKSEYLHRYFSRSLSGDSAGCFTKKIAVKLLSKLDIFSYQVRQILELFSKVVTPMLV